MEINTPTPYLSIGIIGVVIAALYHYNEAISSAYLVIFITIYILAAMRFVLEWKYYRRHHAIIASLEFLLLPYSVLITGLYLTHLINGIVIIDGDWSLLSQYSFRLFLSIISLSLVPPLVIMQRLLYFYHSKRWEGFAIHRKLFTSRRVPLLVNTVLVMLMLYMGISQNVFDVVPSLLIGLWLVHIVKYYILTAFGDVKAQGRRLDSMLSNTDQYAGTYSRSSTTQSSRSTRKRDGAIPAVSRYGSRTVSNTYKNARQISTSSKKQGAKRDTQYQTGKSTAIKVAPGNELKTLKFTSPTKSSIKNMLPTGRVNKSDLSCMFCYEAIKSSDKNVILCPNCKFPSHADEYASWIQVSNLCARCSKTIAKSEQTRPRYRISANDYVNKVLKQL